MGHSPEDDRRILEALEACRPGKNDVCADGVTDPAMARLAEELAADEGLRHRYEQLQLLDSAIGDRVREVPTPDGLAERLLLHLEVAKPIHRKYGRPLGHRRRWLAAASVATVAAATVIGIWIVIVGGSRTYRYEAVHTEAERFFLAEAACSTEPGHLFSEKKPPYDFPLGRDVKRLPSLRWRLIDEFMGHSGVAYDYPSQPNARATLYVIRVRGNVDGLPSAPPRFPTAGTAGCRTWAWQSDHLLYVLVVRGQARPHWYLNLPVVGEVT